MTLPALPESAPVDQQTGQLRPEWRRWLKQLEQIIRDYETRINALENP